MAVAAPLCLAPTLDSLKPFSLAGLASTLLVVAFMGLRCFTPDKVAVAAAPAAAAAAGSGATIILLSTLATATLAHYNAPAFRAELADPQGADLRVEIFTPTSM